MESILRENSYNFDIGERWRNECQINNTKKKSGEKSALHF